MDYAETFDAEGKHITNCTQCEPEEYSITVDEAKTCGVCPKLQHRFSGSCVEFTKELCAKIDAKPSFHKCVCDDGELPVYSVKTNIMTCDHTCDGDLTIFTGGAIPALICHQTEKTILNTTCPESRPLNITTGLCQCGVDQATIIERNEDGTLMQNSICVPLLLDSYHITHCNENALMAMGDLHDEVIICAQTGNL